MGKLFQNQVVWITGASSGIGEALARKFYAEGAVLALSSRREDRLKKICDSLGPNAFFYPLDVRDPSETYQVAKNIVNDLDKMDVAIANAGYGVTGPFLDITEDMWKSQYETNVFGAIWTLKAAIPYIIKSKGRIAVTSSVAGKIALRNSAAYASSKFALMGITNALYQELYPLGVSVTNLAPGIVESEICQVDNSGVWHQDYKDPRPQFLIYPAQKAANDMVKAIFYRKREAIITGHGKIAAFLGTHFSPITYWGLAKSNIIWRSENNSEIKKHVFKGTDG